MTEHQAILAGIVFVIVCAVILTRVMTLKCKCTVCKRAGKTYHGH